MQKGEDKISPENSNRETKKIEQEKEDQLQKQTNPFAKQINKTPNKAIALAHKEAKSCAS